MSTSGKEKNHLQAHDYQITVYGKVDQSWSEWFGDLILTGVVDRDGSPITRLTGTLRDQGALRGVLNSLWDLNLTLLSVKSKSHSSRRKK
jgi:hypothetical protein